VLDPSHNPVRRLPPDCLFAKDTPSSPPHLQCAIHGIELQDDAAHFDGQRSLGNGDRQL
jgi:hypothetical protein